MTQFEKFRSELESRGVELRLQWSQKREQGDFRHYQIRNGLVDELIVFVWPDGGFSTYYPTDTISLSADIERVAGREKAQ